MPHPTDVPEGVRALVARLADAKPMRRGSLSVRYLKCNKPGCACAADPEARHGPYTSVVRTVGGKTQSHAVAAGRAEVLKRQVETGQRFRKDVEAYWDACERWADAELVPSEATSAEAAKKGGSKRTSTQKSARKSRR